MYWSAVFLALAIGQITADPIPVKPKPVHLKNVAASIGSRIVSGWTAEEGQITYQTSLRLVNAVGGVSGCGGSIIHRSWIMTAAHCTVNQVTVVVRAGVTSLLRPEYISETLEWYDYPSYDPHSPLVQPNDISLVKLQTLLTYSGLIQPIRLQSKADATRNYAGERLIASGFGRTWTNGQTAEVLQWVYLRGISNFNCLQVFQDPNLITAAAICAGFYNVTSQSTCQGDSGGPLVHEDENGVKTLVGVTSFVAGGTHGCHSGIPAGFYRPGPFHGWFTEVTGIDFEKYQEDNPTTLAPTTPTEAPDSDEDDEEDSEQIDPEIEELLKKLIVKVKVKVKINDEVKKKVKVETETDL